MTAGLLLTEWRATPREAQSVMDALRLFVTQWDHEKTPIELPFVLVLLLNLVRGDDVAPKIASRGQTEVVFATPRDGGNYHSQPGRSNSADFFEGYGLGMSNDLPQLVQNNYETGPLGYLGFRMQHEYATRFGSGFPINGKKPMSTWAEYPQRVRELGRFIEPVGDEEQPPT